jgi:PAS domain S-box-containing protein
MSDPTVHILQKALQRERLARKQAEKILEQKSLELYEKTEEMTSINENLAKVIDEQTIEFNGIFDNIMDSYILMDLHGNVLKMNEPAKKFFGYDIKKEKFNVTDIIYEEDYEYAYESFYQLIEVGYFEHYQARIYTKYREIKWVEINSRVIRDGETEPRFAHGIVRDITEIKEQQAAFNAQKQQLDAIVDNSTIGIVLTVQGRVLRTNAAFQKMIGYTEEELSTMTVVDVAVESDKEETLKNVHQMIAGEIDDFTMNKQFLAKDGQIIWARTRVAAVRDDDGAIKYEVSIIEDITEELKQGALLEALNNLMASLLGKTDLRQIAWEITKSTIGLLGFEDCVIYILDDDKKELQQVAAFGDKLGDGNEILNQISIPYGEGVVGTVAKTGIPEIIADTSKDPRYIVDDKVRLSEISVPIIRHDEVLGVIDSEHSSKNFFTEDHLKTLTTIATLVSTKLKYALSLKQKEKAEREKEQLLKDLQKSNQELNDFAHVVSHDLKSPLRGMNTLVNWIKEDLAESANPEINKNFDLLLRRIDRMDLMINGILKYASIDKVDKKEKKVDLGVIVNDVLDSIHIPNNFTIKIKNNLPILKGDSYKLMQLFQNLITNAIKYCDKEQGIVEIGSTKKGKFWQFSIADNGKGIEKKYQEKIFQIFQVLEESEYSTGVGLSIVKKVIDFYKGEIWLESEVGVGTTFYFTLPK